MTWNANSISQHSIELLNFLENHNVDVACITETKLSPSKKFFLKNYKIFRIDRNSHGGGVAVIVRCDIEVKAIRADAAPCEAVGVKVSLDASQSLNIFSAYSSKKSDFTKLSSLFDSNIPTIIAGDLNAKHTAWRCRYSNTAAILFLKLVAISKFQ